MDKSKTYIEIKNQGSKAVDRNQIQVETELRIRLKPDLKLVTQP
jgi:hypothetical protein